MTTTIDPISYNAAIEAAGKAAFKKAQSVYRSDYDTFPQTHTWETTTEDVRECWRKIAAAAVASLHRTEPQTAPAADRETLQTLLDLLNPLHGALDRQMYVDKPNPDFDPHPDDETDVIVTAKMERDLTQAVRIIESRIKDGVITESPPAAPADAERLALAGGDIVDRLKHAIATATNDDETKPLTDKRARQVERIDTMLAAIDEIERLRAGGWREDMQS